MRKKIFLRYGREFLSLSCDGLPRGKLAEETQDLFQRVDKELRELSLALENTVRIRIWGRDKEARNLATAERSKILTEKTKASSSSYICPEHFNSNARVALDLIAMRTANPGLQRKPVEYDPPRKYLSYLIYDSFAFLSGITSAGTNLDNQLAEILTEIEASLGDSGTSWDKVISASFYLHRSQKVELLRDLLGKKKRIEVGQMEFCFVDGFASEGRLIEVDVTAKIDK
ncbi:MAG: hypothetical protein V3R58_03145 [candidate division NC10 bacterium]